jgi:hypothetical protein
MKARAASDCSCEVVLEDNFAIFVCVVKGDARESIFRLDVPVEVPGELTSHVVAVAVSRLRCALGERSGCGGRQEGEMKVAHQHDEIVPCNAFTFVLLGCLALVLRM